MISFETRPYQAEAKDAILREWQSGILRTLLVLPTGTGKTIVFCQLLEEMVRQGKRCLILAHRSELLDQAADKLRASTGLGCSVEKAEQTCLGQPYRVVVGSIQSLMRPKRLAQFNPDYFDVIIVDEAHHVLSDSYQRVLAHFAGACVLGVTATPDRGDLRDLGEYFQSCAYEYSLPKAIKDGYLVPIHAHTIPIKIDISQVGQQAGDFQVSAMGSALDPYLESIADQMVIHCNGRKTVVFLPLIATSQKFCAILKVRGFRVWEVNGESRNRKAILRDFDAADEGVICNSMLLTEGWDCPSVDCIVPLRFTKIRSLFCQMVGRGTRLHPGKTDLLLLDFLWTTSRLDLCRPAGLIADSEDMARVMTDQINEAGVAVDLMEAETNAEGDCIVQREDALAKELAKNKKKKGNLVNILAYEKSICDKDLSGYVPDFGTNAQPPTPGQCEALEKAGIWATGVESTGKAGLIIEKLAQRREAGLATPKQIRKLESYKFKDVSTWTNAQASSMMTRISMAHWRVPHGIDPTRHIPE